MCPVAPTARSLLILSLYVQESSRIQLNIENGYRYLDRKTGYPFLFVVFCGKDFFGRIFGRKQRQFFSNAKYKQLWHFLKKMQTNQFYFIRNLISHTPKFYSKVELLKLQYYTQLLFCYSFRVFYRPLEAVHLPFAATHTIQQIIVGLSFINCNNTVVGMKD